MHKGSTIMEFGKGRCTQPYPASREAVSRFKILTQSHNGVAFTVAQRLTLKKIKIMRQNQDHKYHVYIARIIAIMVCNKANKEEDRQLLICYSHFCIYLVFKPH